MQQYQKLIYTVCLQFVHEPHTAEALTQDTFLSAFSAIDRCEPQYYKQWLVRVAANKCKDHLKSAWVRKVDVPGDDALPEPRGAPGSDADDPAQSVADRAGAAELETLVRGLREPYGKIAVLYFREHRETAEIAKRVGRPPATVNSQLWRAKLLLRQQIEDVVRKHIQIMDKYDPQKKIALMVDEWGTWWDEEPGTINGHLYQQNTMRDAFVAALTLNVFHKYTDRVKMTNIAQIVNVLQSMILTNGPKMLLTPTYYVFQMYNVHQDATFLPMDLICDKAKVRGGREVPMVSASASKDHIQ